MPCCVFLLVISQFYLASKFDVCVDWDAGKVSWSFDFNLNALWWFSPLPVDLPLLSDVTESWIFRLRGKWCLIERLMLNLSVWLRCLCPYSFLMWLNQCWLRCLFWFWRFNFRLFVLCCSTELTPCSDFSAVVSLLILRVSSMCALTEKCWFWRWSLLISGLYSWIVLLERRIEFSSSIRLNAYADFPIPLFFIMPPFGISFDQQMENWFWKIGPICWTYLSKNSVGPITCWDVRSWNL